MRTTKIKALVNLLQHQITARIHDVAREVQESVVNPYLRRKNYDFYVGNGTWLITDRITGASIDDEDLPKTVHESLHITVDRYDCLGIYMEDFHPPRTDPKG